MLLYLIAFVFSNRQNSHPVSTITADYSRKNTLYDILDLRFYF